MELHEKFEWAYRALSFYDYEQAEKTAWQIREARPDLAAVYLLLGNIYTNTQRDHEAVNAYQQAVELDPDSAEGYNNLGIAYRKTGNIEESLEAFQNAHTLLPDRADISYNLANCHKQLHNDEGAEEMYRDAIRIDPSFLMAYNNLGTLFQRRGSTDKAIELYKQGLEYDPNHPTLRYNLGIAYESLGNYDQAIREYRRSLKSKPGWASALNNLGVVLQKADRLQEADQAFHDLLRVEPKNYQAYNNIGVLRAAQQQYDEAEEYFKKSLSLQPAYQSAVVNLGKMYVESGASRKALEKLQSILEKDPDNHEVRFELSALLLKNGKANAALHHIIRLLHIDQNNPDYLLLLGKTRHKLGSNAKALPPLERALKLRGGFEAALIELACTLADMSRHREACRRLEVHLQQNPGSLNSMITHAEIELDARDLDKALSEFQELNKNYPNNERILKGLLNAFQQLGNREEALRIAEELVHLYGNPEINEDFDKLEAGLQLYEQIVNDLAGEKQNNWQENLRKILQTDELETAGEMDQYIQALESESDEDIEGEMVPIIDVGGIEPVIAVNEEDGESINLIDMEEDIEPPEEEKEEEEPEKLKAAFAMETGDDGFSKGPAASDSNRQSAQQDFRPPHQVPPYPPQYPQQQQYPPYPPPQYPYPYPPQYQPPPYPGHPASQPVQQHPQVPPQPAYQQQPPYMPYPMYQQPAAPSPAGAPSPEPPEPAAHQPDEPEIQEAPEPQTEPPEDEQPDISGREPIESEPSEPEPSEPEPFDQFYPQDPDTIEDALLDDTGLESIEEGENAPETASGIGQNSAQGLFDYLTGLIEYLPDEEKSHYEESDMRLRVEALRTRLKGRGGLHAMAEQIKHNGSRREPAATGHSQGLLQKSDTLKPDTVRSAFSYLQNLSEELPNPSIGVALKQKMHDIIEKLRE